MRQLARVLAVSVHDEEFEAAGAVGAEDDLLAVRRITPLGVVARRRGEAFERRI